MARIQNHPDEPGRPDRFHDRRGAGLDSQDTERHPQLGRELALPADDLTRLFVAGMLSDEERVGLEASGVAPGALLEDHGSVKPIECALALQTIPLFEGLTTRQLMDLASVVTCKAPYEWSEAYPDSYPDLIPRGEGERIRVVAYDFGAKRTILRSLVHCGFDVTVVPANTPAEESIAMGAEAVFLSNGPGDPAAVSGAIEAVGKLVGKLPIFGICLGHQILSIVLGAKTHKMPFGHHGANHPVRDITTGRIEITSQNHSFAVDPQSLPKDVEMTHINLNDQTVEGLRHKTLPIFSVQYHPEAAPGPLDSAHLFQRFRDLVLEGRASV